jgi:hypothetical protein
MFRISSWWFPIKLVSVPLHSQAPAELETFQDFLSQHDFSQRFSFHLNPRILSLEVKTVSPGPYSTVHVMKNVC